MSALIMAVLGALVASALLAVAFSLMGVALFNGFVPALERLMLRSERFALWLLAAFLLAAIAYSATGWPVGGLWVFVGVLSIPALRPPGSSATEEIAKVEAIATWAEQIRDTMNASAGLQQALIATAANGPAAIAAELARFARRAPRGDLGAALHELGEDLRHPSADMVVAGLLSATELEAGRLVPLLSRLASSIRDEAQMRVRVEVGRARIRTSMKIVGVCVSLTGLLLVVAGGELLKGYESAGGQVWLLVVGIVVVTAVWSSRRLAEVPHPERFVARRRMT